MAYALETPSKSCTVGQVRTIRKAQGEVVVHRYKAQADGRLRVHWLPVYEASAEQGGAEVLGDRPEHHGMRPLLENVPAKRLLCAVQLHDVVMSHAAARQLDRAGWTWRTESVAHVSVVVGLTDARTQLWNQSLRELGRRVGEEVVAQARCEKKIPQGVLDFVELGLHQGELTQAVRRLGLSALDGLSVGRFGIWSRRRCSTSSSGCWQRGWCRGPSMRRSLGRGAVCIA